MTTAAQTLAEFATELQYDRIPGDVVERAKACVIDTVGACTYGSTLPWSKIVIGYAEQYGRGGQSTILGTAQKVHAPLAALANGALAHAFEMDCLVQPSAGVHPGASLTAPGLAIAQEVGASGRDFITAVVAGGEVMHRIGDASKQSTEHIGFHAPGVTGAFGGAVIAGRLLKLSKDEMTMALGIAGSLGCGLLEFSKSGGGMVKRLHLGRAAESGVLAATLAKNGFSGPATVLEGKFGYMHVFCHEGDPARLTAGLGESWKLLTLALKRYACHVTSHVPVTAALELQEKHKIQGDDVAAITIEGSEKMFSHHNILEPQDMTMAQYSTPFNVALALYLDPMDPRSFSEKSLSDPKIRALAKGAKVELFKGASSPVAQDCRVTFKLKNGKEVSLEGNNFKGTPTMPLTRDELLEKFLKLAAHRDRAKAERLFSQLAAAEKVTDFSTLDFAL
jgi:2-methylcitrate dehydratase PrpD